MSSSSLAEERISLVQRLHADGYVRSDAVARALEAVPREAFLEAPLREHAYRDSPLPIGGDQTISAPHMVAIMCEALDLHPGQKVLEVGGGSGYHAAVVAQIVAPGHVVSIEFDPKLARRARESLERLGIRNVTVRHGDGAAGAPDLAPFDRIYLACAAPDFPAPLFGQVASDGLLLAPIGRPIAQLIRRRRIGNEWQDEDLGPCSFVPLRGMFGSARPFDK